MAGRSYTMASLFKASKVRSFRIFPCRSVYSVARVTVNHTHDRRKTEPRKKTEESLTPQNTQNEPTR